MAKGILTDRQGRFVEEYPVDFNATKAAERSGYSKKTARSQGQRLLTNVDIQEALQENLNQISKETNISIREIADKLIACADVDPLNVWNVVKVGDNVIGMTFKDLNDIPSEVRKTILGIKTRTTRNAMGNEVTYVEVRFESRLKALELLGRYKKMFTDKLEVEDTTPIKNTLRDKLDKLTVDELKALANANKSA